MKFQQHLHHPVVLGSLLVDFLQQLETVHSFYHTDVRRYVLHLVGLQMTDEMPFYVFGQVCHLLGKFLLMTLSKNSLSLCIGSRQILLGMKLADGYQTNTLRQLV